MAQYWRTSLFAVIFSHIGFLGVLVIVLLLVFAALRIWIGWDARRTVQLIPRKPMLECDKHGLFPLEHALKTTVPAENRPDIVLNLCPFCWLERMENAKESIKL